MSYQSKTQSRARLIEAWTGHYGSPPPKGLSTRLLRMACAYQDQVKKHGGLKKHTLRELMRYAQEQPDASSSTRRSPSPTQATAGTRLVREWRGQTHVVDVTDKGILYNGELYKSLSQVARSITGARWSGPRFFGV